MEYVGTSVGACNGVYDSILDCIGELVSWTVEQCTRVCGTGLCAYNIAFLKCSIPCAQCESNSVGSVYACHFPLWCVGG